MIWKTKKGYKAKFEEAVSPFTRNPAVFFDGTTTVFNVGESSEWCVGVAGEADAVSLLDTPPRTA